MQIEACDKAVMVRTSRSVGAVGKKAILPNWIGEMDDALKQHLILDFGCGHKAIHVQMLRERGFEHVYGVDLEPLENPNFEAPDDLPWHLVYASNVLNIQPSYSALRCTLCKLSDITRFGVVYMSYPASPRKLNIPVCEMEEIIFPFFVSTYRFRLRNTTIFKAVGRKCQKKLADLLTVRIEYDSIVP